MAKNLCAKRVDRDHAYEVWESGDWTTYVLKKYGADDTAPYARWYCLTVSPGTGPRGNYGDRYVRDVTDGAVRVK